MTNAAAVDKQKAELRLRMIQATNAGMRETEITRLAREVYAIHGRAPATDTPANINNPFFHNTLFDNVNDNRGGGLFSPGNNNSDNRGGGLFPRGNTNSALHDNVNDNLNPSSRAQGLFSPQQLQPGEDPLWGLRQYEEACARLNANPPQGTPLFGEPARTPRKSPWAVE